MEFYSLILSFSLFAWVLAAIRQYPTKYRYFFFLMSLGDTFAFFFFNNFNIPTIETYMFFSICVYLTTNFMISSNKKWIYDIILVGGFMSLYYNDVTIKYIFLLIHSFIVITFAYIAIIYLSKKGQINLFHILLVFYELSVIMNFSISMSLIKYSFSMFYTTVAVQGVIALFFGIFSENSKAVNFSVKNFATR